VVNSKAWNWKEEKNTFWLKPSEESYYITNRWKENNYQDVLDFGCGLGRHSILFAKNGFNVSAFDLSNDAVSHLNDWAKKENLSINTTVTDMINLPYQDNSFDAIFAYHVISHTDTVGIKKILSEITRTLRHDGEIYLSLCSKETWSFKDAGYPKVDENTVVKTDEGPEKGIPHFYVEINDILELFSNFEIITIRHVDDCYFAGKQQNSKHYFITAKLTKKE